jgi:F0F1-type ATP synthase delta subunit
MLKITSDHGKIDVAATGTAPELMAELTTAINAVVDAIVDNSVLPREFIVKALAGGLSIANGYCSPAEALARVLSKEA